MRETIINPLGLITLPNRYGQYRAGACAEADNVVMRAPGTLRQMPARAVYEADFALVTQRPRAILSTGARQVLACDSEVWWLNPLVQMINFDLLLPGGNVTFTGSRAPKLFARSRSFFGSDQGILVAGDYANPTTAAERAGRYAGLPQPVLAALGAGGLAGGPLRHQTAVGYSCVIKRQYADGYELVSPPALIAKVVNDIVSPVTDLATYLNIRWSGSDSIADGRGGVREGDVIEVYRTPNVAYSTAGFGNGVADVAVGNTLYLVFKHTLSSAGAAGGYVALIDTTAPEALGADLYTNPFRETLQAERRAPPHAKAICTFKGFTFYGNVTTPAQAILRTPHGIGAVGFSGAGTPPTEEQRRDGVGYRLVSGTATNGNNTITGISATDILGITVGQWIYGTFLPVGTYPDRYRAIVTAVGASSITMSKPAIASGAVTAHVYDVIELDGVTYRFGDPTDLAESLWRGGNNANAGGVPRFYYLQSDQATLARLLSFNANLPESVSFIHMLSNNQAFAIEPYRFAQGSMTMRATHGDTYDPPIPTMTQIAKTYSPTPKPNVIAWSWLQQPEGVAPVNYLPVGVGEIYAMAASRDAVWIFCSDGLYRLTGDTFPRSSGIGANWRVDPIDPTLVLAAPNAWCLLRDTVYAYTNRGLVAISDSQGVRELSSAVIGDLLPGANWSETLDIFMAADERNDEVWLMLRGSPFVGQTIGYLYSARYDAYTRVQNQSDVWALHYDAIVVGGMLLFTASPSIAAYSLKDGAGGTASGKVVYQPIFADDPMAIKQWIDMTVVCSLTSAGKTVGARYNAGSSAGAQRALVARASDARVSFGVDRNAPAVSNTLRPGVAFNSSAENTPVELYALSLRFEQYGDQQVIR